MKTSVPSVEPVNKDELVGEFIASLLIGDIIYITKEPKAYNKKFSNPYSLAKEDKPQAEPVVGKFYQVTDHFYDHNNTITDVQLIEINVPSRVNGKIITPKVTAWTDFKNSIAQRYKILSLHDLKDKCAAKIN